MKTKKELKEICKILLNQNPIGHLFDNEDHAFLVSIFENHPSYNMKLGAGIASITTARHEVYGTKVFILNRIDGSQSDISYIQCFDGASTKKRDIKLAMRSAISHIVMAFKNKIVFGVSRCEVTGDVLMRDNCHIDHYDLTFNELAERFIAIYGVDYLYQFTNDTGGDMVMNVSFCHSRTEQDFIRFHNENTHLRAVTKYANLSILKKK